MEDAAPEFGPNGAVLNSGIIPSDKVEEYRTGRAVYEKLDTSLHPKWLKVLRYAVPLTLVTAYILMRVFDLRRGTISFVILMALVAGWPYLYWQLSKRFANQNHNE